MVPLSAVTRHQTDRRTRVHHALQRISRRADQRRGCAGLQFRPGDAGAGRGIRADHAVRDGIRLQRHVVPGTEGGAREFRPAAIFGLSLFFVFLILAAQYESWSLPFSVLLGTPIAVFGAYLFPLGAQVRQRRLRADWIGDVDRTGGEERHPDRGIRQRANMRTARASRKRRSPALASDCGLF